jgi:hypothetical protein
MIVQLAPPARTESTVPSPSLNVDASHGARLGES